jgi:hypothetical protein
MAIFRGRTPLVDKTWVKDACDDTACTRDAPELLRCSHHHLFVIDDLQRGRRNHKLLTNGQDGAQWIATGFTEAQFHMWRRVPDPEPIVSLLSERKEEVEPRFEMDNDKKIWWNIPKSRPRALVLPAPPPFTVSESVVIPLPKKDQLDVTEWQAGQKLVNRFDHWAKIKGELWKVPSKSFFFLDKLYENGKLFRRERVSLELPLRMLYQNGNDSFVERIITEQEAYMYIGIPEIWEPLIDGGYLFQPVTIYENPRLSRKFYTYSNMEE